jgi:hypothetical protein
MSFTNIPGGYITPNGNVVMSDGTHGIITPNKNIILENELALSANPPPSSTSQTFPTKPPTTLFHSHNTVKRILNKLK